MEAQPPQGMTTPADGPDREGLGPHNAMGGFELRHDHELQDAMAEPKLLYMGDLELQSRLAWGSAMNGA